MEADRERIAILAACARLGALRQLSVASRITDSSLLGLAALTALTALTRLSVPALPPRFHVPRLCVLSLEGEHNGDLSLPGLQHLHLLGLHPLIVLGELTQLRSLSIEMHVGLALGCVPPPHVTWWHLLRSRKCSLRRGSKEY